MSQAQTGSELDDVTRRLADEFSGTYAIEIVARCVEEARAQLGEARIEAYIPMFVARRARDLLRSRTHALRAG